MTLAWIPRGLRQRRITTRYPVEAEQPPDGYHGPVELLDPLNAPAEVILVCPTGALAEEPGGSLMLDRGRCIGCGECIRAAPDCFAFARRYETAAPSRQALIEPGQATAADVDNVHRTLGQQARALRRSIHVRHLDAGSDGAEEWEIQALWNPYYDIQRLGFFLTSSPRHADILIVTGGVSEPLRKPLELTWRVMPSPKALIAAGTDACSGGVSAVTGLTAGGVDQILPVDVYVPGSPPSPIALLDGFLQAVGLLRAQGNR